MENTRTMGKSLSTAAIDDGWTLSPELDSLFAVGAPLVKKPQRKLDLNAASLDELCELPGIGRSRAARIIAWRETNGPFVDASALLAIDGIGSRTLAALSAQIA